MISAGSDWMAPDGRCFPVARSVTLSTIFNLADRNRICLNGETPNDVQAGQRQTSFSGRDDAHLRRTVNKFQRPSILQLNIEGLTASKMSVLHHLALQCEALVILLQETHSTSVERLDLPSYHLAGFSLSRKHGLATFVHERLKWILIDQSPPTSEIEWVCVDVDNYKIVNVYKPPPTRMQASDLPAFPHPCLYAGDFNCHHVDWGYNNNNPDGECLAGWASANNFTLLYSPKEAASFHSGRWKTDTNPDLAFASVDLDSRLPDRRILGKFPRSQHRPSLISPPKLAHPKPSKPVKRWNFRKANWDHYSNLTNKLAKSIPPPESQNIDQVYQCFCKVISTAAKKCIPRGRRSNHIPCWDAECEDLYQHFLQSPGALIRIGLPQPYSQGSTGSGEIAGQRRSATLTFRTPSFGVKLDRSLTYRPHLEALRKKLSARVSLLRRLVGTGWGASAKTLRTAALSLVYSTAEHCAPVWCRSVHIRLIDSVINDALRIVTGCLRPTPSVYLPVLSGIQPAELRRQGATLSLANRSSLDPDHILHGQFHESQDVCRERLKSRRSFVPAARKLLDSLSEMDVRAAEWTNTKWDTEYSANALSLHAFIPKASSRPLGMGLPRAAWVKLNRLRSGVGRFCSSMYKWGLAPLANCECGASEQTADHIISQCPIHRAPRGMFGLMVLDDETRCWLKSLTVSI